MNNLEKDKYFMRLAIDQAALALGSAEPNPPVGAVIVRDGEVLACGHTQSYGHDHAEVTALKNLASKQIDSAGCEMYVTLEPCSHHGKTPPCADAIIEAGLSRVVIGIEDPHELVRGQGIDKLRQAGIEIHLGVMADEVNRQLAAYLKLLQTGRPWVVSKWAQTLDGRMATRTGSSKWISSPLSRQKVHQLRGICDGILVGVDTVIADDPMLTTRVEGREMKNPVRVILDNDLRMPTDCEILKTLDQAPAIIVTTKDAAEINNEVAAEIKKSGAELLVLKRASNFGVDLSELLDELGRRRWTRILIEGGTRVHGGFISARLVDEIQVYIAPKLVGCTQAMGVTMSRPVDNMEMAVTLPEPEVEKVGPDVLLKYFLKY